MLSLTILIYQKEASYIATLELSFLNTMTIYSSFQKTLHMCFGGWNVRKYTCCISGVVSQVSSWFLESLGISVFEYHTKLYNFHSYFFPFLSSQFSEDLRFYIFHILFSISYTILYFIWMYQKDRNMVLLDKHKIILKLLDLP